jgi:hypothetical protein
MRIPAHLGILTGLATSLLVAFQGLPAGALASLGPAPRTAVSISFGQLFAVSADSATDAWAVGNLPGQQSDVVLHWNGTSWNQVPIPLAGVELFGVSAVSASDAWAAGFQDVGTPVVLHWDGSTWTAVPAQGDGTPEDVSADSPNDVWVVGSNAAQSQTFALHWDGSTLTEVPTPSPGFQYNALFSVSARSATDAWAVGASKKEQTLALHWNGTAWSDVHAPNIGISSGLVGVSAVAKDNAWAVGSHESRKTHRGATLVLHWDGTAWHYVYSPSPGNVSNGLEAVSAASATDAWAVGEKVVSPGRQRALSLHWNGTSWRHVRTPNPPGGDILEGVSTVSAADAWAVGYISTSSGGLLPLILDWNGTAWNRVKV